jgi:hypothetical protein
MLSWVYLLQPMHEYLRAAGQSLCCAASLVFDLRNFLSYLQLYDLLDFSYLQLYHFLDFLEYKDYEVYKDHALGHVDSNSASPSGHPPAGRLDAERNEEVMGGPTTGGTLNNGFR